MRKKAFVSVEIYAKNYAIENDITMFASVSLSASKSIANPQTIERKIIHEYKFNPIEKRKEYLSENKEKDICIDQVVISELHKFQDEADLLFDTYIKEKQKIYDIEVV